MGGLVLDASVTIAWLLRDELRPDADALFAHVADRAAEVPNLYWHEVRNALLTAERRGRLTVGDAEIAGQQLRALGIETFHELADEEVLAVSRAQRLTAYDGAYAALAIRRKAALATDDVVLIAAARQNAFRLWSRRWKPRSDQEVLPRVADRRRHR